MENVYIFMIIWNILWPFGIFNLWQFGIVSVHLVYFSQFGMFGPKKSGNPGSYAYAYGASFCRQTPPSSLRCHLLLQLQSFLPPCQQEKAENGIQMCWR
jgi:hypothetical protein